MTVTLLSGKQPFNNFLVTFHNLVVTVFFDSLLSLFGFVFFIFESLALNLILTHKPHLPAFPQLATTVYDSGVSELGRQENSVFSLVSNGKLASLSFF